MVLYKYVYYYYYYFYYFIIIFKLLPQVVRISGVKDKKGKNQNVGWLEVRQVNWQSVAQKHGVGALYDRNALE